MRLQIPVRKTNLDITVQASATQHDAELIEQMDSLKKENKKLVAEVNSLQTELSHVSESYISQLDYVTNVNQEMKALLSGTNKDKEILRKEWNKLEAKFAEAEKLQKCKESKQLIRNLKRKLAFRDNQIKSQKLEIVQLKDDIRKIDEDCLQLYGLVKKTTDKLENQMSNSAELEHEKSLLQRKYVYLQRKRNKMDKIMDINKHT